MILRRSGLSGSIVAFALALTLTSATPSFAEEQHAGWVTYCLQRAKASLLSKFASPPRYEALEMDPLYIGEQHGKILEKNGKPTYFETKYLTPAEREAYRFTQDSQGRWFMGEKEIKESITLMGVMDRQGGLFTGYKVVGKFHHSSFTAGEPVGAAVSFVFRNGKLVEITRNSGHYKSKTIHLLRIAKELRRQGFSLAGVEIEGLPAHLFIQHAETRFRRP